MAFSLVLVRSRVHGAVAIDRTCSGVPVEGAVLAVGMRSKLPGKIFSAHGLQPQQSTKVKLTHLKEIQKSMEVKRRKEAKKQNDFCGGKRHIATFQNYRNQVVLGRPRKAWYRRKASFTSCSARWQRTWHVQRYWRAKGAKCTLQRIQKQTFKSSTKGRTIPWIPFEVWDTNKEMGRPPRPPRSAKLFVHARAAVRSRSIETAMRRLTSNDRNGAISYWIFENKISSFRKLQDLSNGIFAFKIGLETTSNEVRKTTWSLSFEFERSLHDQSR